jgi:transposase
MEYFAGLDVSMEETHVCVVDREGKIVLEARTPTAPKTIAAALAKGPSVDRVLFETGRMAPTLFHGLTALGLPVVCVESRQAYQALRSLAAHKTDRNDARGLAHLARTGFFKPVHVKSLPSHAVRALLIARKKLVGQRVTLENQIRGLAVAFVLLAPMPRNCGPFCRDRNRSGIPRMHGWDGRIRTLESRDARAFGKDLTANGGAIGA